MSKSRYYALKQMGKCVICGKNPADEGYATCLVCRIDRRNIKENRSTESVYHHKQWLKRLRDLRHAFGVCIVCGKRDADFGSHTCSVCNAAARIRSEQKRIEKGITPRAIFWDGHHCAICGKEMIVKDLKVCEECYPKYKELMLNARSQRKGKNYFEKLNEVWWME